jgi:ribosome-associated protein
MNKKKKDIEIHTFQLGDKEYIELNQLLKFVGLVETGGHANYCISEGQVKVNGAVELRKRNKIRVGFQVEFDGHQIIVEYL